MSKDDNNTKKPAGPRGTKKPSGPPGTKKPSGPSGTKKPSGPPGTRKPSGPPQAGSAGKAANQASPSGSEKKAKKPTLPPGYSGDGGPGSAGLTRKDFTSDQDVRWCPGCGDYAILATMQRLLPDLDVPKEDHVFISGIGCAARFPYYVDAYGIHSIHGRAPAIATGLKASRPELDVWIITGDGDALSIGGNHLLHILRRNVNVQMLLFNNQIYGLTKGQYSPTSERGKITKSSPYGSIDAPFNPVAVAMGADATFVARTLDRDPKHMRSVLQRAHDHQGAALVEIYQNCNIFNDGAFFEFTERETKPERALFVEHGEPMTYSNGSKGLRMDGLTLESIDLESDRWAIDDCVVYDETSRELSLIVGRLFWQDDLPRPFGVLYREDRPTYDELLHTQIDGIIEKRGAGDLQALLHRGDTWEID